MARSTNSEYRLISPPPRRGYWPDARINSPSLSARPFAASNSSARGVPLVTQPPYAGLPGIRGRGQGQFGSTACEPLHLLELDAVPRRVADHGVEAADRLLVLPAAPHAGKGRLPVQELLPFGDGPGGAPQPFKARPEGALLDAVVVIDAGAGRLRSVGMPLSSRKASVPTNGASKPVRLLRLHPRGQPTDSHRVCRARRGAPKSPLRCPERELGRLADLGHVGIRHLLNLAHALRRIFRRPG